MFVFAGATIACAVSRSEAFEANVGARQGRCSEVLAMYQDSMFADLVLHPVQMSLF